MPVEQLAEEFSDPLDAEIGMSQMAALESSDANTLDNTVAAPPAEESSSLLAVIGSANAASVPTEQPVKTEGPIDEKNVAGN